MKFNKIKKPNLVKEVYTQLRDQILGEEFNEGEKLPSENKLCSQFDVSRVVIREAMQTLKANKLIVTKQGKGSFVANPENFILAKYDSTSEELNGVVSEEEIAQFLVFRDLIEIKGIELAAKNMTEDDKQIISSKLEKMEESQGNTEEYSKADYEYHLAIIMAGKNEFLATSYKSCRRSIIRCFIKFNSFNNSHKWGIEMHKKLLSLLIEGNVKEAKILIAKNDDYNLARIASILE